MSTKLREALIQGDTRTIQTRGTITIPKEWRDEHEIEQGDTLFVVQDGEELRILPPDDSANGDHR